MRRGAGEHDGTTVVEHFDLGVVAHWRHATGDLDVHADTDAELLHGAAGTTSGLIGAQRWVVGRGEGLIERHFVVADIVGLADGGGVWLKELGDQVDAANLGGIHADLGGKKVHRPLDRCSCLWAACAAIGNHRRGVGDHTGGSHLDVGDGIHATGHWPGHERGQHGCHVGEAAAVLKDEQLVVRNLAVARTADGDVLQLGAAMAEGDHALAAGLAPAQRTANKLREPAEQKFFGIGADLGAEAAAHVGCEHANIGIGDTVGRDQLALHALSVLGADPLVEPAIDPCHGRAANFHGARRHALVDEATLDQDFAAFEVGVAGVVWHAEHGGVEHHVAASAWVDVCG